VASVYPAHRETDIVLRDGSTVRVRPVRAEDADALARLFEGLSLKSRAFRFFSGGSDLEEAVVWALEVDYRDRFGLVAIADGELVAHAAYTRGAPGRAEVAFAIADSFQGHGLGTILLGHLAEAAEELGIELFEAEVLPENHKMIEVFRESGFPIRTESVPGAIAIELPTSFSAEAVEGFEQRDRIAAVAAVNSVLRPGSVAVIGASRARGTPGGELFHNLIEAGFTGPAYPVNPNARSVQSVRAYASVEEIPDEIELAVIVTPPAAVIDIARQCAAKGVRALVVISAGFAESGEEGRERQRELLELCRGAGVRLVGPNCLGVLNTAPDLRLHATFAPQQPPPGRVGFMSQSGALGLAVIDHARGLGLGLSSFASVGNRADISPNDLLQYWEADEGTDLALLYLESFGNPRRFARIARRVARRKPIVAVKSGRSTAGARATGSHTGALVSASDVTVDALFGQSGVIRTDDLGELFGVAGLLATQPLPAGGRVGIVTNAGGPGIMCADACESDQLELPESSERTCAALAEFLPAAAALGNPVDMLATANADDYTRTIRVLGESGDVDAIIAIFIPPLLLSPEDVAGAIVAAAESLERRLPILAVIMARSFDPTSLRSPGTTVPAFSYPEDAARALSKAVRYADWRRRPEGETPTFADLEPDEAAGVISSALGAGREWLDFDELDTLLRCYGLHAPRGEVVGREHDVGPAAKRIGGPVALKAIVPGLVHKTEAGAVRTGLRDWTEALGAANEMETALGEAGTPPDGYLIQEMVGGGVEMLVGVADDPLFGPVAACGAGGTTAEVMHDVSVRITPLSDLDARDMITSLVTYPLLRGYRGSPPANVRALEEVLLRVSAMIEDHREISELDLNPVIVTSEAALVADARVRVRAPSPPAPWPSAE
jgi:acetyl coenzyme A synthetase (ADP forming)-like protein